MIGEYSVLRICETQAEADALCGRIQEAGIRADSRTVLEAPGVQVLVKDEALPQAQALLEGQGSVHGETASSPAEIELSTALRTPLPAMESLAPDPLSSRAAQGPAHGEQRMPPPEQPEPAAAEEPPSDAFFAEPAPAAPLLSSPREALAPESWVAACGVADAGLAEFFRGVLADLGIASSMEADAAGNTVLNVREQHLLAARQAIEAAGETWIFEEAPAEETEGSLRWLAACGVADEELAACYKAMVAARGIAAEVEADDEGGWILYVSESELAEARAAIEHAGETWFFEDGVEAPEAWVFACGVARRGLAEYYRGTLAEAGIDAEIAAGEDGSFVLNVRAEKLALACLEIEAAGETWVFDDSDGEVQEGGTVPDWFTRKLSLPRLSEVLGAEARVAGRRSLLEPVAGERIPRTGLPPLLHSMPKKELLSCCPYCSSERVTDGGVEKGNLRLIVFPLLVLVLLTSMACVWWGLAPWPFFILAGIALATYHHVQTNSDYSHFCRDCKRYW